MAFEGTQKFFADAQARLDKETDFLKGAAFSFALNEFVDKRTEARKEKLRLHGVAAAAHSEKIDILKSMVGSLNDDIDSLYSSLKGATTAYKSGGSPLQAALVDIGMDTKEELAAYIENLKDNIIRKEEKRRTFYQGWAKLVGYGGSIPEANKLWSGKTTPTTDVPPAAGTEVTATDTLATPVTPPAAAATDTSPVSAYEPLVDDDKQSREMTALYEKVKRKDLVAREKEAIVSDIAQFALGKKGSTRRSKLAAVLRREKDDPLHKEIDSLVVDYLKQSEWGNDFLKEFGIIAGDSQYQDAATDIGDEDDAGPPPPLWIQEYEAGQTPRLWQQEYEAGRPLPQNVLPNFQHFDELSPEEDAWDRGLLQKGWDGRTQQGILARNVSGLQQWDDVHPDEDAPLEWPQDYRGGVDPSESATVTSPETRLDPQYGFVPRDISEEAALAEVSGDKWSSGDRSDLPVELRKQRWEADKKEFFSLIKDTIKNSKQYIDDVAGAAGGSYLLYQGYGAISDLFLSPDQKKLKTLLDQRTAAKKNPKKYGAWTKKDEKGITGLQNKITKDAQAKARAAKGKRGRLSLYKEDRFSKIPFGSIAKIGTGLALLGYGFFAEAKEHGLELMEDAVAGDEKALEIIGALKIISEGADKVITTGLEVSGAAIDVATGAAGDQGTSRIPGLERMAGPEMERIPHTTGSQYGAGAYRGPFKSPAVGQIDADSDALMNLRAEGWLDEVQYKRLQNPDIPETVKRNIVQQAQDRMEGAGEPAGHMTATEHKAARVIQFTTQLISEAESGGDYNAVAFSPGMKQEESDKAVTQRTVGQNAKVYGEGKNLGMYQMDVPHMLRLTRKYLGRDKKWLMDQSFTPEFQDEMFNFTLIDAGLMKLVTEEITPDEFWTNLIKKYPSLPGPNQKRGDRTVGENRVTDSMTMDQRSGQIEGLINKRVTPSMLWSAADEERTGLRSEGLLGR